MNHQDDDTVRRIVVGVDGFHGSKVALRRAMVQGLVDTSTPTLLRLPAGKQIDAQRFVTHRFGFDDFLHAYDVFADAGRTGALKVVLSRTG